MAPSDQVLSHQCIGSDEAKSSMVSVELVKGGHMLPITSPELTADFIIKPGRAV